MIILHCTPKPKNRLWPASEPSILGRSNIGRLGMYLSQPGGLRLPIFGPEITNYSSTWRLRQYKIMSGQESKLSVWRGRGLMVSTKGHGTALVELLAPGIFPGTAQWGLRALIGQRLPGLKISMQICSAPKWPQWPSCPDS